MGSKKKDLDYHQILLPYNKYDNCSHSYCNAHILRELTAINEQDSVQWSEDMHKLLTNMNIAVHKAKDSNKTELSKA